MKIPVKKTVEELVVGDSIKILKGNHEFVIGRTYKIESIHNIGNRHNHSQSTLFLEGEVRPFHCYDKYWQHVPRARNELDDILDGICEEIFGNR